MSFSNSLVRLSMSNSTSGGKFLQYYPVHKFNKMQFNEKQQHIKFQKASKPAPIQSKFNKFTNVHTNQVKGTNSNYLVVDDA